MPAERESETTSEPGIRQRYLQTCSNPPSMDARYSTACKPLSTAGGTGGVLADSGGAHTPSDVRCRSTGLGLRGFPARRGRRLCEYSTYPAPRNLQCIHNIDSSQACPWVAAENRSRGWQPELFLRKPLTARRRGCRQAGHVVVLFPASHSEHDGHPLVHGPSTVLGCLASAAIAELEAWASWERSRDAT